MIRWALAVLIGAVLVAAVAVDQIRTPDPEPPVLELASDSEAVILDPPSSSAAWFCPFGSVAGVTSGHAVRIANHGDALTRAEVTVLTDAGPGPSLAVEVLPNGVERVPLDELGAVGVSGAVVELIGGDGSVSHELVSTVGFAEGTCTTSGAEEWTFAGASTEAGAAARIAIMNPFSEDAVIDVDLRTRIRSRQPDELRSAVVPAGSVRVVDLGTVIAAEDVVSTTITVSQGLVVAERLQVFDGTNGPSGSSIQLGTPGSSLERWFPAGRVHRAGDTLLMVANPGEETALVDIILHPLDPGETARLGLIPLELTVPPGRVEARDLRAVLDGLGVSLPFDLGIEMRSANGVPFVGERWQRQPVPLESIAPSIEDEVGLGPIGATAAGGGEGSGLVMLPVAPLVGRQGDGPDVEDVPLEALASAELRALQPDATVGLATSAGRGQRVASWVVPAVRTGDGERTVLAVQSSGTGSLEVTVIAGGRVVRTSEIEVSSAGRALVDAGAPVGGSASLLVVGAEPFAVEAMVVGPERVAVLDAVAVVPRGVAGE